MLTMRARLDAAPNRTRHSPHGEARGPQGTQARTPQGPPHSALDGGVLASPYARIIAAIIKPHRANPIRATNAKDIRMTHSGG